ncbi:MAG: nucleotide exchange factor GrpE [Pseudonocardia sp.]|uniref:nucleotide exchange factor GrpE n=1 Tax=unclassified Pseudonocardia TaxID=2619320 RepID=UPI001AC05192|nr:MULTISPECIES: nucleotide exchange factor GrpE [unclassified Pseudonocardia]MBN9110494.1 nucleotide exchange factor GrpE [Pseudonocardia sp.]
MSETQPDQHAGEPDLAVTEADAAAACRPADSTNGARAPEPVDYEDRWRRALADLDNARKRHARDLVRDRAQERARVAAAFLPVLDTIDLALQHAGANPDAIVAGVHAVRDQALAILAGLGYPRQDDTGVPFDPTRHEVIGVVGPEDAGLPSGSVADVVRPGYGEPDRQLRPASVTVTRSTES